LRRVYYEEEEEEEYISADVERLVPAAATARVMAMAASRIFIAAPSPPLSASNQRGNVAAARR